ncbi:hypothetical protein RI367_002373 [Sorochytrium milnesiophthora]
MSDLAATTPEQQQQQLEDQGSQEPQVLEQSAAEAPAEPAAGPEPTGGEHAEQAEPTSTAPQTAPSTAPAAAAAAAAGEDDSAPQTAEHEGDEATEAATTAESTPPTADISDQAPPPAEQETAPAEAAPPETTDDTQLPPEVASEQQQSSAIDDTAPPPESVPNADIGEERSAALADQDVQPTVEDKTLLVQEPTTPTAPDITVPSVAVDKHQEEQQQAMDVPPPENTSHNATLLPESTQRGEASKSTSAASQRRTSTITPAPTERRRSSRIVVNRDDYIQRIKTAMELRDKQRTVNLTLQNKLAEYFRKKRTEDKSEADKTITDSTQRYATLLTSLKNLQSELATVKTSNTKVVEDHKLKVAERSKEVFERCEEFRKYKRTTAANSEHSRTGKGIPPKVLDQLEALDLRKEQEVVAVRLENIKLRNKLKRHEVELRQKEELADGLHLIDFEQLKIENQGHNEKIEERNEELLKLRKKITNIVQVLAHVKEKLQCVQVDNRKLAAELETLDREVAQKRDTLPRAKQERDNLRTDNNMQRQKNGLIGNTSLLLDYEKRVGEVERLQSTIDELNQLHLRLAAEMNRLRVTERNVRLLPQILGSAD